MESAADITTHVVRSRAGESRPWTKWKYVLRCTGFRNMCIRLQVGAVPLAVLMGGDQFVGQQDTARLVRQRPQAALCLDVSIKAMCPLHLNGWTEWTRAVLRTRRCAGGKIAHTMPSDTASHSKLAWRLSVQTMAVPIGQHFSRSLNTYRRMFELCKFRRVLELELTC